MTDAEQKIIFAKNLNRYLSLTNKTQKEVADKLGVSTQRFNTWCQAIAMPRMGMVQALADYFGINKSDLLDDKPVADETPSYYLDDDARDYAQFLFENPEYRVLFDASRKVKPEDIDFIRQMIDRMNGDTDD